MDTLEEGQICPECKKGEMPYVIEGCSCHINPPCHACTNAPLVCNKCGFEEESVPLRMPKPTKAPVKYWHLTRHKSAQERFEELEDGVFGYVKYPSESRWGMTVRGKMPEGMTADEVLKGSGVCEYGCPHFYEFGGGRFRYTYNYD